MSNYRLDVNGSLELTDYSNIYDYISIVDKKDDFLIALNDVSEENFNMICTMLHEQGFIVSTDDIGNRKWNIKAQKLL